MTINSIVCSFVLIQAETTPDEGPCNPKFHTQKRIQTFLTRCVRTFTPHREHITIIIYLTQLNAGPEFRFAIIYIYIYIYIGPYEIRLNFSQIPFYFFLNSFFTVSIFLDSVFFPFSFYRLLFNDQIKLYLSKSMSN